MEARRAKIIAVLAVIILLAVFLPPNINGTRFRDRLAPALSAALGRQVKIGAVKYRLFPRPGFDLYDFQVMEDPSFGAEPMLMCGKVTADLRLTSLWQGRLEIANLKLTDDAAPPSLNLTYANGHWNLESLLVRAEQVPTAPTAKRSAEQRARFPYIEATGGRINFKKGAEKKSYTLSGTDFSVWLATENIWHFRLEGRPVRTDMTLNDTGTLRLEGDLTRSSTLRDMPVKLSVSWEKTQVGQFSKLLSGQDHGWRGDLQGSAQATGTLSNLHLAATADLSHFHRYDVNRDSMPRLRSRCLGDFAHLALELKCDSPLDPGGVLLTIRWTASAPLDYDLSVVANHVPMTTLVLLARHARAALPDDLTATGDLNAAFGFHAHNGERDWHGTGMSTPFLLQSSQVDKAFPVSAIRFHIGSVPTAPAVKKSKQPAGSPNTSPDTFIVDSFSVQLGPSSALDVQGTADGAGYRVFARGLIPLERLVALGKLAGFSAETPNFTASAVADLNVAGAWGDAPRVRGTAHIQNLAAWIPGIKNRVVLTQADAQLTDSALIVTHMNGEFEHSPVAFSGSVQKPWDCAGPQRCGLEFDLHSDKLAVSDVSSLLGMGDKGWNLPFFSSTGKLPDFRATGNLSADQLILAQMRLEKFTARLELGGNKLVMSQATAKLGGGAVEGELKADWSGSQPRFDSTGTLTGVDLDRLKGSDEEPGAELVSSWLTGKTVAKYNLQFEGKTPQEMLANAAGRAEFTVGAGDSRALLLQASKPLRFETVQGAAELGKQTLTILPSKIKTENRIYEISGKVTLADRQTSLKVTSGASRWEVTGALDKPQIAAEPMTAQTNSSRTQ
ncbi:MAG TPA: AsmA family protein [Candidatus Angelobacter sp.]|nr:AsmA family protein [Candidatus Angelobacter sp.]